MILASEWKDYELLDLYDGEKVERWGDYMLIRPDPQVIWPKNTKENWENQVNARYLRSSSGGGSWDYYKKLPEKWVVKYKNLSFYIKPMGFKHTGLFPEQAVNWDYMIDKIKAAGRQVKVLNLFAYTGGATVACLSAGASVCHVDSSKGMTAWAKENVALSGLADKPVRFIVDDVRKFVEREIRRGSTYDAVIMDPPSYGRGSGKEVWSLESDLYNLIELCCNVLSEKPLFFHINSYTTGLSPTVLSNILAISINHGGKINSGEIGLPVSNSKLILPCGIFGRWEI
ncbi:MAG: class I SAM-dependent methyltransferase [Bacillota bacterium]|nr:class I SAM-dependent methyltransferase [Bacillota bacterium]